MVMNPTFQPEPDDGMAPDPSPQATIHLYPSMFENDSAERYTVITGYEIDLIERARHGQRPEVVVDGIPFHSAAHIYRTLEEHATEPDRNYIMLPTALFDLLFRPEGKRVWIEKPVQPVPHVERVRVAGDVKSVAGVVNHLDDQYFPDSEVIVELGDHGRNYEAGDRLRIRRIYPETNQSGIPHPPVIEVSHLDAGEEFA